jgi:hypothetical protein
LFLILFFFYSGNFQFPSVFNQGCEAWTSRNSMRLYQAITRIRRLSASFSPQSMPGKDTPRLIRFKCIKSARKTSPNANFNILS